MSKQRRLIETVVLFLATAGITASIAGTFLKMRDNFAAVDGGGPGLSVGVICTILFALISLRGSIKLRAPVVAFFAWPALFFAVAWNFLEFGFNPANQDGTNGTRIFLGVLTFALAVIPLLVRLWVRRAVKDARRTVQGLFARGGPGVRIVDVDVNVEQPTAAPTEPSPGKQHRIIEADGGTTP